jgi:hypothetical protein
MEAQGKEEEEAAVVLGASGWQVFRHVTLPNIKWGLIYGVILCNARAMGEFGAVSVVSGHIRGMTNTLPLHVEILYNEYNFAAAFAVASPGQSHECHRRELQKYALTINGLQGGCSQGSDLSSFLSFWSDPWRRKAGCVWLMYSCQSPTHGRRGRRDTTWWKCWWSRSMGCWPARTRLSR